MGAISRDNIQHILHTDFTHSASGSQTCLFWEIEISAGAAFLALLSLVSAPVQMKTYCIVTKLYSLVLSFTIKLFQRIHYLSLFLQGLPFMTHIFSHIWTKSQGGLLPLRMVCSTVFLYGREHVYHKLTVCENDLTCIYTVESGYQVHIVISAHSLLGAYRLLDKICLDLR